MRDDLVTKARPSRPPQDNIPRTKPQRDRLLDIIRRYVRDAGSVGPLSLEELWRHSDNIIRIANVQPKYRDYIAVLVNNELWREIVAGVPYDRRLLLLPQCLRDVKNCKAQIDELGLVCKHCGRCVISELQSRAEQLGYAVLVAEGSPVVMSLIESGKIEAVIGVSCLSVLEQVFPYMSAGVIAGIAIPLLQDGCADTSVDIDWLWEAIYENSEDGTRLLNLQRLRSEVQDWFTPAVLRSITGQPGGQVQALALQWLGGAGKRWRPFLTVCAYQAVRQDGEEKLPAELMQLAVAVECFHKASLIHDDIEDADVRRYDDETMHVKYGVPIALNVGDFLLGEGYRLLAELKAPAEVTAAMLRVAARGHRSLCLGQGKELSWVRRPGPLSCAEAIDIYKNKTAPAFAVALNLGVLLAGGGEKLGMVFKHYSEALGIAYQIKDDIDDFDSENAADGCGEIRPSFLLALAFELAEKTDKELLLTAVTGGEKSSSRNRMRTIFEKLQIIPSARATMESYKSRASGSLVPLKNANLKGLLRRVICKIFNDIEIMSCCDDYQARYGKGGKPG